MYTRTWDEATPNGATVLASDLDTVIQNVKTDVRERVGDIFGIGTAAAFDDDPIAPSTVKLNRVASSTILGGTVSFAVRNAADTADNLLVSNAGVLTVRAGLTVTTGGIVASGNSTIVGTLNGITTLTATTVVAALTGNATTATALATVRTIWGQNFDGSANVSGALTGVTTITTSGAINSQTISATANFTGTVTVASNISQTAGTAALQAITGTTLTLTSLLTTVASAAVAGSGFRLPHGVAPNSPSNGDVWTTTGGIFARINGVTQTLAATGSVDAGLLTGTTLNSGVTASSLTSFGTLAADLLFTDATYDIGKSGATRPRDGFFSRNVTIGGTASITGAVTGGTYNSQTISATANFTGSVTVANGFTVSAGTSALQALTATTGVFSSTISGTTISASAGFSGTLLTAAQANITSVGTLVSLNVTGAIVSSNDLVAGAARFIAWFGRTQIHSPSDGALTVENSAGTDSLTVSAAGLLTVASLTVTTGTSALQALTATTATLTSTLTYGGVTLSAAVTGTGNMVLSASPTFTGTVTTAAISATTGTFSGAISATTGTFTGAITGATYVATSLTTTGNVANAGGTVDVTVPLGTSILMASNAGMQTNAIVAIVSRDGTNPVSVVELTDPGSALSTTGSTSTVRFTNNTASNPTVFNVGFLRIAPSVF